MIIYTCGECGHKDNNQGRFEKHRPCNPEDRTVWLSAGSAGYRHPNDETIAARIEELFAEHPKVDSVSIHHGRCNLGVTTPDPCDCAPTTVLRAARAT